MGGLMAAGASSYSVSSAQLAQGLKAGVTKVRLNRAGIRQFLKSAEVRRDLMRRGQAVQAALPTANGEQWLLSTFDTDRANVTVRTGNDAARETSAETMALIRALDRGR
jgi:hypothetical protein